MNKESPGVEFYVGNARLIADAALTDRWRELHQGEITQKFVLFPPDRIGWTELIELVVSEATGRDVVPFGAQGVIVDIEADGLSVRSASRDWTTSVASLNQYDSEGLPELFKIAFRQIYGAAPESELVQSFLAPFRKLSNICQDAESESLNLVEVYLADW